MQTRSFCAYVKDDSASLDVLETGFLLFFPFYNILACELNKLNGGPLQSGADKLKYLW